MSAFSANTFVSSEYALYRPSYSVDFFQYIFKYFELKEWKDDTLTILDIGSGPGTCFSTIIPLLKKILNDESNPLKRVNLIASDLSNTMLKEAEINLNKLLTSDDAITIKYIQSGGETIDSHVEKSSVDLVIAAECAHWLNSEQWLSCMHKILKPNGVLSYWGYVDPVFVNFKHGESTQLANEIYDSFVYEEEGKLGPYWEQPGRGKLRKLYRELNNIVSKDETNWKDFVMCLRDPLKGEYENVSRKDGFKLDDNVLKMEMILTFDNFLKYMDTWSSSFKWNQTHEDKASEIFFRLINEKVGVKREDEITIQMKSVYVFVRKQ